MGSSKVFGIGFQKTGTTSLAKALTTLGNRVTGPKGVNDPDTAAVVRLVAWKLAEEYDAFQDNLWPILAAGLDHFRHRPRDLLVLPITQGAVGSELCRFLGCLVP